MIEEFKRAMAVRFKYGIARKSVASFEDDLKLLRNSPLFDAQWYKSTYPDVGESNSDPALHYLLHGGFEKRNPSDRFDSEWYLSNYKDVSESGQNPLIHYLRNGSEEGRLPLRQAGAILSNDVDLLRNSGIFDVDWYLATYTDISQSAADPVEHYLAHGWRELRDPSPVFSTEWYLKEYGDVKAMGMNPLVHFLQTGKREGRIPTWPRERPKKHKSKSDEPSPQLEAIRTTPLFNRDWYLSTYSDVAKSGMDPAFHYLRFGAFEGYSPNMSFDSQWYIDSVPGLKESGENPLIHYLRIGEKEKRPTLQALAFRRSSPAASLPLEAGAPYAPATIYQEHQDPDRSLWLGPLLIGLIPAVNIHSKSCDFLHLTETFTRIGRGTVGTVRLGPPQKAALQAKKPNQYEGQYYTQRPDDFITLSDAWLIGSKLKTRIEHASLEGRQFKVQAIQIVPDKKSEFSHVGESHLTDDNIIICEASLINRFAPVLIVVTDNNGDLVSIKILPFPSLCRGGLHHAEMVATNPDAEFSAQICRISDVLLNALLGHRNASPFSIGEIYLDSKGATSAEAVYSKDLYDWLTYIVGIRIHKDDPLANRSAQSKSAAHFKGRESEAHADLLLPANCVPTLSALFARGLEKSATKTAGGFVVTDTVNHNPLCSVHLPTLGDEFAQLQSACKKIPFPILLPRPSAPIASETDSCEGIPFLAVKIQNPHQRHPASQLLPHSTDLNTPLLQTQLDDSDHPSISVMVRQSPGGNLLAFLSTLKQQTLHERISQVELSCHDNFRPKSELTQGLETLFSKDFKLVSQRSENPKRHSKTNTKEAFLLFADTSVLLHDPRTLEVLYLILKNTNAASAACLIVEEKVTRAGAFIHVKSGGYFPTHLSLLTRPKLVLSQPNSLEGMEAITYPVAANSSKLMLVRRSMWEQFNTHNNPHCLDARKEVDFALKALKSGHKHFCTSIVRAGSIAPQIPEKCSDVANLTISNFGTWQDILLSCTIVQDLS